MIKCRTCKHEPKWESAGKLRTGRCRWTPPQDLKLPRAVRLQKLFILDGHWLSFQECEAYVEKTL